MDLLHESLANCLELGFKYDLVCKAFKIFVNKYFMLNLKKVKFDLLGHISTKVEWTETCFFNEMID